MIRKKSDSDKNYLEKLAEQRYQFALKALDRYLLESLVIQQLAKSLDLDVKIMAMLLKTYLSHPADPKHSALQTFLDESFLEADPDPETPMTWNDHPNPFFVIKQIHKLILVIKTLNLNPESLTFLMEKGGPGGMPDLRQLPRKKKSEVKSSVALQWIALCKLVLLDREYLRGEKTVFAILDHVQDGNTTQSELFNFLSDETGWEVEDLDYLTGTSGLNLTFPDDYQSVEWLIQIAEALKMVNQIGATAQQIAAWTAETVTEYQADSVRYAVKAKYGDEQWLEISVRLRDRLREKQRDALLSYVLHHVKKHDGKPFEDLDDIYAYFLMDTQTAACAITSRTVLASSSSQLFVQRIMMNLEPDITLPRKFAEQWKWRKYYRVWEANRKVLLWPENWIEPELRDDKTPFFKELENELLQDELNEETVERVYVNYLHRVDEVARLTICGVYYDEEQETLHVFGQTAGVPPSYFYRRWEKRSFWTAWEKVELDIHNAEGVEEALTRTILVPVIHNRRLFLFWPIFRLKNIGPTKIEKQWIEHRKQQIDQLENNLDHCRNTSCTDEAINNVKKGIREKEKEISDVEQGHNYYELRMAWSQYRQGNWTSLKTSSGFIRTPYSPAPRSFDSNSNPIKNDNEFANALTIDRYIFYPKKDSTGNLRIIVNLGEGKNGYDYDYDLVYDDCKSDLITPSYGNWSKKAVYLTLYKEVKSMKFLEAWGGLSR